jgi:flagellar biosynthesis protein FlhF
MRMKMFTAESFDKAQALIFAEFGRDAVILSERVVDGGVEVRAAIDRAQSARLPVRELRPRPEVQERAASDALRGRLRETLTWHGMSEAVADMIALGASRLSSRDIDARHALASALEGVIACAPIPALPDRNILLVGPAGAGRTATAAKLVRRAALTRQSLVPVAADFDATAGAEQLRAYLSEERDLVRSASDPDALFATLASLEEQDQRCVIDLPAINPFDTEDLARMHDLVTAIGAEPILVMSAEGHPADLEEAADAFARLGVRRVVLTRLDAVRRRGGAFAAIASARLSLSHLGVTPFIGGGLVPAASARIAALLTEDAPVREALKGAA